MSPNIKPYQQDIITKTQELVDIASIEGEPDGAYPFGLGPAKALEYVLELGQSLGFKVKNVDHYAGHVELGVGDEILGILGHVDVVPVGEGWSSPPFKSEIRDDKIFGRGTLDDKGPIIAALYAMKTVADLGIPLNKRIRLIVGTNEETGSKGIKHYLAKEEAPTFAFAPDADFPVIHGEKGIIRVLVRKKMVKDLSETYGKFKIEGGTAINMVPDSCFFEIENRSVDVEGIEKIEKLIRSMLETSDDYEYKYNDGKLRIKSFGKAAHASTPEHGENAISKLMLLLNKLELNNMFLKDTTEFYTNCIGMNFNGEKLGIGLSDEVSGKLTCNLGLIRMDATQVEMEMDIRYPLTKTYNEVVDPLVVYCENYGFEVKVKKHVDSIFIPKDNQNIQKLMHVYQDVTGDYETEPLVIGGGTYARELNKAVAFGPLFPGVEDTAHQKDEHISIDDLMKCSEIYAKAIIFLTNL
jgi:succinyl-diaminopimelate desuccinylase